MQEGIRHRLGRLAGTAGVGARRWSGPTVLGLLCAGAFGPLLAAAASVSGTVALAGVGVLAAVGGNVLTDVLKAGVAKLREGTREEAEDEIQDRIVQTLAGGGPAAEELRADLAAVLRATDAAGTALSEAVELGDRGLQSHLTKGFAELGRDFGEFAFLLEEISAALATIQRGIDERGAEHRLIVDLLRTEATHTRLLRDDIAAIRRRTLAGQDGAAPGPRWAHEPPYRGLHPFGETETEIFYGREQLTAELVGKVAEQLDGLPMVIVSGSSGVGKSSLIQAGLLPAVARGSLRPQAATWPRIVMTPTMSPLEELATRLALLSGTDGAAVRDALAARPADAALLVRQAALSRSAERLLLVVDQFEEVFDHDDAQPFITALHAAAATRSGPDASPAAIVVLAVRSDFLDRCAAHPLLAAAMRNGQFVVGPMTESELRRAIVGPAEAAGLTIEPGLTDTILAELGQAGTFEAGSLPLLSQTMLATWENRTGDRLTTRGYGLAGGVAHAVQTSAESVYLAFPPERRQVASAVFRRLTVVTRDARVARRRVSRPGLAGGTDLEVLEAFAAKRLVVLNEDSAEIAHDVLLRSWPRLRGWLEEDQAAQILLGRLHQDAIEWDTHGRDPAFLYRDTRLAAARTATGLDALEQAFLDAGLALAAAERRSIRRRHRVRTLLTASLAVLLVIAAVISGRLLAALGEADRQRDLALSRQLLSEAQTSAHSDPVLSRLLTVAAWRLSPRPADLMLPLKIASLRPELALLRTQGVQSSSLAFSPDGKILAVGTDSYNASGIGRRGAVQLWDVATRQPLGGPLATREDCTYLLAFSPDGRTLAVAGQGPGDEKVPDVQLWDVATRRPAGRAIVDYTDNPAYNSIIGALAFSPDGHTIAIGTGNTQDERATARLWDTRTGALVRLPLPAEIDSVDTFSFDADGRRLAAQVGNRTGFGDSGGYTSKVWVWDVASREALPAVSSRMASAVAFSPVGGLLALHEGKGKQAATRVWDLDATVPAAVSLADSAAAVGALAFSADGMTLAAAEGGTARLWDVASRRPVSAPLASYTGVVESLAFSPDGTILAAITGNATDGRDNDALATVQLWNTASLRPRGTPIRTGNGGTASVAFSRDGRMLATGGSSHPKTWPGKPATVQLWNAADRTPLGELTRKDSSKTSTSSYLVTFTDHGRSLAATSMTQTVHGEDELRLETWDAATRQPIKTPASGQSDDDYLIIPSPGGDALAVARQYRVDTTSGGFYTESEIQLRDRATAAPLGPAFARQQDTAWPITFSPDGTMLGTAVAGDHAEGSTVQVWDTATRRLRYPAISVYGESILDMSFDAGGKTLAMAVLETATGSDDKVSVRLWDLRTGTQVGAPISSTTGLVTAIAVSPDGQTLATGGAGGEVYLWNLGGTEAGLVQEVCRLAGRSFTEAERRRYLPDAGPGASSTSCG